jgi:hypothetical protein
MARFAQANHTLRLSQAPLRYLAILNNIHDGIYIHNNIYYRIPTMHDKSLLPKTEHTIRSIALARSIALSWPPPPSRIPILPLKK